MPTRTLAITLFATLVAGPLAAQRILQTVYGTRTDGALGQVVRAAGDVDNDGVTDLVVTEPAYPIYGGDGQGRVYLVSGATRAFLWTVTGMSAYDATGIADVNGDGHRDVVVSYATGQQLRVISGATGQLLFTAGGLPAVGYRAVGDVGDVNGDGRGDFAAIATRSTTQVDIISGNGGTVLGTLTGLSFSGSFDPAVRTFVDITGDGRPEFLVSSGRDNVYLCSASPLQVLRTIPSPNSAPIGEALGAADVDGDGVDEILVQHESFPVPGGAARVVHAIRAATGQIVRTFLPDVLTTAGNWHVGNSMCSLGDLDGDGADEVAAIEDIPPYLRIDLFSGRTGAVIGRLDGTIGASYGHLSEFSSTFLDSLGDLDGDGFGDFACGVIGAMGDDRGGFQIISGKILADLQFLGGACGGGPFFPQLGMTRPILGQQAQIVLRDGAPAASGTLALSLPPPLPIYLGASTCTAYFDIGNWVQLFTTTQPQWSLPVGVPNVPPLAGMQVALQCFYAPTAGPLGFDLSNGIWARIGY